MVVVDEVPTTLLFKDENDDRNELLEGRRIWEEEEQPSSPIRSLSHLYTSVSPLIISDATLMVEKSDSPQNHTMEFTPPDYVTNLHMAPRFGHTNRLGKLASLNPKDALDYAGGLKQFSLFVIVPFIIWAIILVLLKFFYGIPKIGCAAGGEILDMKLLAKAGISRKQRKRRILRSWRLHSTFMIFGVLIPSASLTMMRQGWTKVQIAWDEVKEVVDDVESLAYQGWDALDELKAAGDTFTQHELINAVLEYNEMASNSSLFATWCPNIRGDDSQSASLRGAMDEFQVRSQTVLSLFELYAPVESRGFEAVTQATHSVDQSLQWFFDNDWIWKMYIMVLNVLNVFLLLCVYIFSKNSIIHPPTRFYLTFIVVPLFCAASGLLLMVMAISGVAALLNADFCAGGSGQGSPQGTIRDAILSYYHGSVVPPKTPMTGKIGLAYDAFNYYAEGCLSDHPLAFFEDYANEADSATVFIVNLSKSLPNTPETVLFLNNECGSDMSFLPGALISLETGLLGVRRSLDSLVEILSCHSISPLVRRLTHGPVCNESPKGLTWIWGCSLFMGLCCFVMLSTRAALYNSIKKRKQREKKSKRVVEKEFEEYKEFMLPYFEDAAEWKLHTKAKKTGILEIDFGQQIQTVPTLETEQTSSGSDNLSEAAGILSVHSNNSGSPDALPDALPDDGETRGELDLSQRESSDDMYDSDYESDSDASEGSDGGDDESALLSFYTETKSILSETRSILSETKSKVSRVVGLAVANLRSLRPLLGQEEDELSQNDAFIEDEYSSIHDVTDTVRKVDSNTYEPTTIPSTLAFAMPVAPIKPMSLLGRTTSNDDDEDEHANAIDSAPTKSKVDSSTLNVPGVDPQRHLLPSNRDLVSSRNEKKVTKKQLSEDATNSRPSLLDFRNRVRSQSCDGSVLSRTESRLRTHGQRRPSLGQSSRKDSQDTTKPVPRMGLDHLPKDPTPKSSFLNLIVRPRSDSEESSVRLQRRPSFLNLMTRQQLDFDDFSVVSEHESAAMAAATHPRPLDEDLKRQQSANERSVPMPQQPDNKARENHRSILSSMTRPRADSDDDSVLAQITPRGGRPSFLGFMTRRQRSSGDQSTTRDRQKTDLKANEVRPTIPLKKQTVITGHPKPTTNSSDQNARDLKVTVERPSIPLKKHADINRNPRQTTSSSDQNTRDSKATVERPSIPLKKQTDINNIPRPMNNSSDQNSGRQKTVHKASVERSSILLEKPTDINSHPVPRGHQGNTTTQRGAYNDRGTTRKEPRTGGALFIPYLASRPRLDSDDSNNISLYIDELP